MKLVLFLLCSGCFFSTLSSTRLRIFSFSDTEIIGVDKLLNECKRTNESAVTLFDEEDADFTAMITNNTRPVWLGLHKGRNITWSDGSPVTFNIPSACLKKGEQMCEAIENKAWRGFNCADKKFFMCYKGNDYFLIEKNKDWCHALQYCRQHYTDLVSISNDKQNMEVIEKGKNQSFWIGLLYDEWEWFDKGCSSFRKWGDGQPREEKCTANGFYPKQILNTILCEPVQEENLFCSKGHVKIKVIQKKYTFEQAIDYCQKYHDGLLWIEDEDDQKAVEQWLNHTNVNDDTFWINLRQNRASGSWVWSDRTVSYSNWENGIKPELPFSNHCGVITKGNYTWSDEDCLVLHYFLCEEEIIYM